jgi:hypothetical protein
MCKSNIDSSVLQIDNVVLTGGQINGKSWNTNTIKIEQVN